MKNKINPKSRILILCALTLLLLISLSLSIRIYAGFQPIKTEPADVAFLYVSCKGHGYFINNPDEFSTKINPSSEDMEKILNMINANTYAFDHLHIRYLSGRGDACGIALYDKGYEKIKTIIIQGDGNIRIQTRVYKITSGSIDLDLIEKILNNYLPILKTPLYV